MFHGLPDASTIGSQPRFVVALYHPIEQTDMAALCGNVGLTLQSARGVAAGSINTNYALTCAEGRFFLRFTHVRRQAELEFEGALLAHLREGGFPCPRPLTTAQGLAYQAFEEGFVSIFPFQPGEELPRSAVTLEHAFRAGETMGRMHRLAASFGRTRTNPYGEPVVAGWLEGLKDEPDAEVQGALPLLARALERTRQAGALPVGAIHADYFRDNVKWLGDRISAVFDFEMACTAPWMLDVGIGLCEWAFDESFEPAKMRRFLEGYTSATRPRPGELDGLYEMTLFAGVRYSLSRIRDFHLSKLPADALARKDWRRYLRRTRELLELEEKGFLRSCGVA